MERRQSDAARRRRSVRVQPDRVLPQRVYLFFTPSIERVVNNFAVLMPVPGYLCVGASESLLNVTTAFSLEELDGAFVYATRGRDD